MKLVRGFIILFMFLGLSCGLFFLIYHVMSAKADEIDTTAAKTEQQANTDDKQAKKLDASNQSKDENGKSVSDLNNVLTQEEKSRKIPIILYHEIVDNSIPVTSNSRINYARFEEQIKYLSDEGYKSVSLNELSDFIHGRLILPQKAVMITFDNEYENTNRYAYTLLKKCKFKAVWFLVTGQSKISIDKAKMRELGEVFEFASHSHSVSDNDKNDTLVKMSDKEIANELKKGKELLNTPAFAYPAGIIDDRIADLLSKNGCNLGFGQNGSGAKVGDNPFKLSRTIVSNDMSLDDFKRILE